MKTNQSWDGALLVCPQGQLEMKLKNGKKNVVKAGDALAEVVNTAHRGKNIGTEPVQLLIFYAEAVGQANSALLMKGN